VVQVGEKGPYVSRLAMNSLGGGGGVVGNHGFGEKKTCFLAIVGGETMSAHQGKGGQDTAPEGERGKFTAKGIRAKNE